MADNTTQTALLDALQNSGVDLDAIDGRRQDALAATPPVLAAAGVAVDLMGTPGASSRVDALRVAIEQLLARDPVSAVVVAAALWVDRYGSSGAPVRLADLQSAVDTLRQPTVGQVIPD